MSDQNVIPFALEEIAQFLDSNAAQYLLYPESMDSGSLGFKREIRLVLDKLRSNVDSVTSNELMELRYVAEGGREVVERDILPIVVSVQDETYRPPIPQAEQERYASQRVPGEGSARGAGLAPSNDNPPMLEGRSSTIIGGGGREFGERFRVGETQTAPTSAANTPAAPTATATSPAPPSPTVVPQAEPYATSRVPGGNRPTPAGSQQFPQYEGPTVIQESRVDAYAPFDVLISVSRLLQPEYRDFVLTGAHEAPATTSVDAQDIYLTTGARQLTAGERQFLDRVRANPLTVELQDYRDYVIAGDWVNDDQTGVGQRLSTVIETERKAVADFKQSENQPPSMRLPEGMEWYWNNAKKRWGIRKSDASKRVVTQTVSDNEIRTGRFTDNTAEGLERAAGLEAGEFFLRGMSRPGPNVPPTDRGTLTDRSMGTWFGLENLTPDQRRAVLELTGQTAPSVTPTRPAPSVPPTDRGTLGAQPASVGTVSAPSVPPTDRGTVPGVTQPALTPEQRYGTGGAGEGPPDRMGGPPTITPRMPADSSTATTTGGITPGGTAGAFDPAAQLAVPPDAVMGDAISPFVAAPGAGTGTTGDGGEDTGAGGGGGGGGGAGVPTYVPEAPAIPEEWEQAASEIYGAYYSIIKQNPEVAALIAEASANKWGPEKFDYALEQTEWWRTTSIAIREFDIEYARDPATVQARIDALAANLQQTALDLNIRLTNETLNRLATDATRQGWTEQQVTNALGTEAIKAGATGITGLRYGFYGNKINEIAGNYGVSISDTEFNELVNKFAVGQENEESLTSSFQTRATALFPAISERLMAGETFRNIVEPYRARASQILGRDFSATDFMDNDSFAQAVTYMGDDGKQRPMTYTEWGQYLRSNRETASQTSSELSNG